MTLVNMCNNCPHNPVEHRVIGGAEVVPDWMQYVKDTFWNKPELLEPPLWLTNTLDKTQTFSQQEQHQREIEDYITYKNKDLLKTIAELPAEYRPIFKNMFEELTKQIVEAKLMSFTDGESKIPPQQSCKKEKNKC